MMLRTWEAVSTERELPGVLASLADVLVPLVPFDSIGIIDFTVPNATPDEDGDLHRLLALHVVGVAPIDGETPDQLAARSERYAQPPPLPETRPLLPYPAEQKPGEVARRTLHLRRSARKGGLVSPRTSLGERRRPFLRRRSSRDARPSRSASPPLSASSSAPSHRTKAPSSKMFRAHFPSPRPTRSPTKKSASSASNSKPKIFPCANSSARLPGLKKSSPTPLSSSARSRSSSKSPPPMPLF